MKLPEDPVMLLSFVNTKLRDQYASLDALCDDLDAPRAVVIQLSADRKRHLSSVCSCQNLHVPTSSCSFCTSVRFQYSLSAAVFLSKECAIPFLFACSVFFSLALFPSDIVKCCYHIKGRTA